MYVLLLVPVNDIASFALMLSTLHVVFMNVSVTFSEMYFINTDTQMNVSPIKLTSGLINAHYRVLTNCPTLNVSA